VSVIFYAAVAIWAGFMLWFMANVLVRLWCAEDRSEAERIKANWRVDLRRYVDQMAELEQIDNLAVLEAFRIKEGLD
jgi:NRPS condensation-like uncharacterized protein